MIRIKVLVYFYIGNFDFSGDMGRFYGIVGFVIEIFFLEVEVRKFDRDCLNDNDVLKFLRWFREFYDFLLVEVIVCRYIFKWVGIGFYMIFVLIMGVVIFKFYGFGLFFEDVVLVMCRGLIIVLGFYVVKVGGFIYEGGFLVDRWEKVVFLLIFRGEMFEDWFFVVVILEMLRKVFIEVRKREDEIFGNLKKMFFELVDRFLRIVFMKIFLVFVERDIRIFGEGLY